MHACVCVSNLYLCGQIVTDSVQQRLCGFVFAQQHQLQVHVAFDQEAFGHEADPHHSAQRGAAAGLSVVKRKADDRFLSLVVFNEEDARVCVCSHREPNNTKIPTKNNSMVYTFKTNVFIETFQTPLIRHDTTKYPYLDKQITIHGSR